MRNLPDRLWRATVRVVALVWLLVVAPAELASTLAARLSGPAPDIGPVGAGLILLRVLVVAAGLILGRRLLHHDGDARLLAIVWACADLGTLALVLASARIPSNRPPGDAPLVWVVYAAAAIVVVVAARATPLGGPGVGSLDP